MDDNAKVFGSNITRVEYKESNNLYELLNISPAKQNPIEDEPIEICNFTPKIDKTYEPKKRSRLKVRTVRDIRNVFEEDIYNYLTEDLEKQRNFLLRKIRDGSSNNDRTKNVAKKILDTDNPICRSSWQMLVNINPYQYPSPKQVVVWRGRRIQINGSRGGNSKIIHNYDLKNKEKTRKGFNNCKIISKTGVKKRNGLLQNSLTVKFKPGPLGRKKFLDDSHQKYHIGQIELAKLPRPALEIQPTFNRVLDPTITNILNNFRYQDGLITEKWAEFAVSVLGSVQNECLVQTNDNTLVTFDLKYTCDKKRILMRRDIDDGVKYETRSTGKKFVLENIKDTFSDVQNIMDDILNAVEISLMPDDDYYENDDTISLHRDTLTKIEINAKDKTKKRYSELDRLDVTVIKLPRTSLQDNEIKCEKAFCRLGCICDSLNYSHCFKQHCGVMKCMFSCKCELSKYIEFDGSSELVPELLNINKIINSRLSKEEQKFHQTVVFNGERSIVLKDRVRKRTPSKRIAGYAPVVPVSGEKKRKVVKIIEHKLNCNNIEPWCMVHNLYRCFCKGRFTQSSITPKTDTDKNIPIPIEHKEGANPILTNEETFVSQCNTRESRRLRARVVKNNSDDEDQNRRRGSKDNDKISKEVFDEYVNTCARTSVYQGRKYSDGYYKITNLKIREMEQNDISLQKKISKRMINEIFTVEDKGCKKVTEITQPKTSKLSKPTLVETIEILDNVDEPASTSVETLKIENHLASADVSKDIILKVEEQKNKIRTWLERNYKIYKERVKLGMVKTSLDAPKKNKIALHTWDFLLARYRERKNLFLVTKEKPYRLFLAINSDSTLFEHCINIDDIGFADFNKYPTLIKNLLTNCTDTQNYFCILGGWDYCWELVGCAEKISGEEDSDTPSDMEKVIDHASSREDACFLDNPHEIVNDERYGQSQDVENTETQSLIDQSERSKWFLMTIENDFTEMQFYKKGFYVKYDNMIQAIQLARGMKKTVRLSSHVVCSEKIINSNTTQFGVYASPNTNLKCVFVGPYEINEPLGLETLQNVFDARKQKRTRGVWIITNKVDNLEVINDPLSFMPLKKEQTEIMLTLGSQYKTTTAPVVKAQSEPLQMVEIDPKQTVNQDNLLIMKPAVKPIKISRTNGFYHLSPDKLQFTTEATIKKIVTKTISLPTKPDEIPVDAIKDIKITSVYSESEIHQEEKNTLTEKGKGMFILKPEEINKKLLDPKYNVYSALNNSTFNDLTAKVTIAAHTSITNDEVLCLSDEEENDFTFVRNEFRDVWICCVNINLGWIPGRVNDEKLISFKFPGFKFTEYYPKQEALKKINQVLSRKVYVPKSVEVKWEVFESESECPTGISQLDAQSLQKNRVLTKYGLTHVAFLKDKLNVTKPTTIKKLKEPSSSRSYQERKETGPPNLLNKTSDIINQLDDMDETCRILEDETVVLWNEALSKENDILNTLIQPENITSEMSDSLQNIRHMIVE